MQCRWAIFCGILALGLAGCAEIERFGRSISDAARGAGGRTAPAAAAPAEAATPAVPADARTAEEFDVTSAEERAEAAAQASGSMVLLGRTVVSLGDPGEPGFWLRTPLVRLEGPGRMVYPATGKGANVTLLPAEGGGSRISLAAMRLIGAPLTELVEVEVYRIE